MARTTNRPVVTLKSTAGTGVTYVTRKSRRNDPDRLVLRKYDPVAGSTSTSARSVEPRGCPTRQVKRLSHEHSRAAVRRRTA